jgi:hypothetical protein
MMTTAAARLAGVVGGLALSLTLDTTPVVHLYLDCLRRALSRRRRDVEERPMPAVAAE